MFGPVISQTGRASSPSALRSQSFAMKLPPVRRSACSTTGCRPPLISNARLPSTCGRVQSASRARPASATATSISANALAVAPIPPAFSSTTDRNSPKIRFSMSSACPAALRIRVSISDSLSVVNRTAPAVVCRCTNVSESGGFSIFSACPAGVSMKYPSTLLCLILSALIPASAAYSP